MLKLGCKLAPLIICIGLFALGYLRFDCIEAIAGSRQVKDWLGSSVLKQHEDPELSLQQLA
jgi:hypothetical protein